MISELSMPTKWTSDQKLFPYQVGFTSPPFDFDAAPSDFLRLCPPSVGVHGRMMHIPNYNHQLEDRKDNFHLLEEFVHCMSRNGVDTCGQVGSNWVHASNLGVEGIKSFCNNLSDQYEIKFHMAGYDMIEALRFMNVEKVALNAAYHWPDWWQGTVNFLKEAGFDVVWAGNFVDQGWFKTQEEVNAKRWIFDSDLALKSFVYVANKAPKADAILINGMCNFRTGANSLPQRPIHLIQELEKKIGKLIIGHDIALYWALLKDLSLPPVASHGQLLESLR